MAKWADPCAKFPHPRIISENQFGWPKRFPNVIVFTILLNINCAWQKIIYSCYVKYFASTHIFILVWAYGICR